MGDRANVVMRNKDQADIFFYTHWSGTELPELVRDGLTVGKSRWNDPAYLARIIFCNMLDSIDGITGYGISTVEQDNECNRPWIIIDCDEQAVKFGEDGDPIPFDEYIKNDITWP